MRSRSIVRRRRKELTPLAQKFPGFSYLERRGVERRTWTPAPNSAELEDELLEEEEDLASLGPAEEESTRCLVNLSICLSPTFRVPVLFFTAHATCTSLPIPPRVRVLTPMNSRSSPPPLVPPLLHHLPPLLSLLLPLLHPLPAVHPLPSSNPYRPRPRIHPYRTFPRIHLRPTAFPISNRPPDPRYPRVVPPPMRDVVPDARASRFPRRAR